VPFCGSSGIAVEVLFLIQARELGIDRQDNTTRFTARQERKFRRFPLSYPVHVEFRSGELVSELDTVSRNVSTGGLLSEAPLLIPQGSSVSFVMILRGSQFAGPIELSGEGDVVRVEPGRAEAGFGIAVKCISPIRQIEHYSRRSSSEAVRPAWPPGLSRL
jgi:hypothetical protein